jgi:hypothetical protein
MNARKTLFVLLLACLLFVPFGSVQTARAADGIALVDQENVVPVSLYDSIQYFSPVGQSFTPMLPGLDVVEFWTADFSGNNGYGGELYVNIREASIYGPILGTSDTLQLPDNFYGLTRFTFPALVSLKPGNKYVMEVVVVGGKDWIIFYNWGIGSGGGPYSTYPGGDWILDGVEMSNNDLWFREGFANLTPQSSAYCKRGLWAYLTRTDGSSFKNQGDCTQYVNTGK